MLHSHWPATCNQSASHNHLYYLSFFTIVPLCIWTVLVSEIKFLPSSTTLIRNGKKGRFILWWNDRCVCVPEKRHWMNQNAIFLYKLNKASVDCRVIAVMCRSSLLQNQKSLLLAAQKLKHLVIRSVRNQRYSSDSNLNHTGICWAACQSTWWTALWAHALPVVKACFCSDPWWEVVLSIKALNNVQLATDQWSLPRNTW